MSFSFRWDSLRSLGESNISKATVVVPLVGYMIIFNDTLVAYLDIAYDLTGASKHTGDDNASYHHNTPTRLLIIYFALCFIASGTAIFRIFCPSEIKLFQSIEDYVLKVRDIVTTNEMGYMRRTLERDQYYRNLLISLQEGKRSNVDFMDSNGSLDKFDEEFKTDVIRTYFGYMNNSRPRHRTMTAICYAIGIFGLAVPSFDIFIRVCVALASRLPGMLH